MLAGWGTWIASWGWGAVLICITVACQVTGVVLIQRWVDIIPRDARKVAFLRTIPGTIALIVAVALCLATLFGIESLIWAVAYVWLGAVPTSAAAVLYSVSSMTTRGVSELSRAAVAADGRARIRRRRAGLRRQHGLLILRDAVALGNRPQDQPVRPDRAIQKSTARSGTPFHIGRCRRFGSFRIVRPYTQ